VWGAERKIDVILKNPANGKTLGVECKYQGGGGSAEEKVPTTIQDIGAWPIDGIVGENGAFYFRYDDQARRMHQVFHDDPRTRAANRAKLDASGMRNLSRAMNELNRLADRLHLPQSIKEEAAVVYREALKRDLIKGRTISGFVVASVYAACRKAKIPRSLQEVSDASIEDKKDVARTYRYLIRELNLKLPVDYPMKFVPKIAAELDVSREADELSIRILREAKERRVLAGRDPRGMAAAALYMACKASDERVTQKDIAEVADTTEVTLRNRLRDLEEMVAQTDELSWVIDD